MTVPQPPKPRHDPAETRLTKPADWRGPSWMDLGVALSVVSVLSFTGGVLVGKGRNQPNGNDRQTAQRSPADAIDLLGGSTNRANHRASHAPAEGSRGFLPPSTSAPRHEPTQTPTPPDAASANPAASEPFKYGLFATPADDPEPAENSRMLLVDERLSAVTFLAGGDPAGNTQAHGGFRASGNGLTSSASGDAVNDEGLQIQWREQVASLRAIAKSIQAWNTKLSGHSVFAALLEQADEVSEPHDALALALSLSDQLTAGAGDLAMTVNDWDASTTGLKSEWRIAAVQASEEYLITSPLGDRIAEAHARAQTVLVDSKLAERHLSQTRTAVDELSQSLRAVTDAVHAEAATSLAERVVDPIKLKLDAASQSLTRLRARMEADRLALSRALELFPDAGEAQEPLFNPLSLAPPATQAGPSNRNVQSPRSVQIPYLGDPTSVL